MLKNLKFLRDEMSKYARKNLYESRVECFRDGFFFPSPRTGGRTRLIELCIQTHNSYYILEITDVFLTYRRYRHIVILNI